MTSRRQRLKIEVPSRSADAPRWGWVGIIAVAGFAAGIVLARVAGWQLVPKAPVDPGLDEQGDLELAAASASAVPLAPSAAPAESAAPAAPRDRVTIGPSHVTSCRDAGHRKQKTCDPVTVDEILSQHLGALGTCKGTEAATGTLSLGLDLDLDASKLLDVESGRSTDLPRAATDALLDCAREAFAHVSFSGVEHKYASYTVFTQVELSPAEALGAPPASAQPEVVEASGSAVVTWEVAIVRDTPKSGAIVARILGGTRLVVTGRQGDWYRVKYDAKGREGWVYKSAVGK